MFKLIVMKIITILRNYFCLTGPMVNKKLGSAKELDSMSTENKRNTLIVELLYHSSLNTQQLQAKQNTGSLHSLTGMTAIFYFLYTNNIRSIHELRSMSDHDQRHALIMDLQNKLNKDVSELQGMSDHQLVVSGADFYRKVSKT